jgi:RNA polymerase sigma factor (sigma-70 family)
MVMKQAERFERMVLAHLDAAYNFARWLTHDEAGAEDAVQDACLRAFRFFDSQQGASPKAWFMTIVRNACLDWLKANRERIFEEELHEQMHAGEFEAPDAAAVRSSEACWLHACIATLPRDYREVLVLRELEELSYKEIGAIVGVPVGTVMSRLARGRDLLQRRMLAARNRMSS